MKNTQSIAPVLGETAVIPAQSGGTMPGGREVPRFFYGRVTYINRAHRWYMVEADIGGAVLHECFKF